MYGVVWNKVPPSQRPVKEVTQILVKYGNIRTIMAVSMCICEVLRYCYRMHWSAIELNKSDFKRAAATLAFITSATWLCMISTSQRKYLVWNAKQMIEICIHLVKTLVINDVLPQLFQIYSNGGNKS